MLSNSLAVTGLPMPHLWKLNLPISLYSFYSCRWLKCGSRIFVVTKIIGAANGSPAAPAPTALRKNYRGLSYFTWNCISLHCIVLVLICSHFHCFRQWVLLSWHQYTVFQQHTNTTTCNYHFTPRYHKYTSPSVSVASRRITPSQRPLRDLCSLVFGATRLKETTKKSYLKSRCLITPFGRWNQVNPTYFWNLFTSWKQQQ